MLIFKKYFIVFLSILLLAGCSSSNKIKNADVAFDLKKYGLAIPLLEKEYLEVKKPSEKSAIAYKLVKANNFVQNARVDRGKNAGESKNMVKVIRAVKSDKTGAYVFKEKIVHKDNLQEALKG